MVTYHTVHKRHAIWKLDAAPDPPKPLTLYQKQQTRSVYASMTTTATTSTTGNNMNNNIRQIKDFDLMHFDAAAATVDHDLRLPSSSHGSGGATLRPSEVVPPFLHGRVTRDQALADALGVVRRRSRGGSSPPRPAGGGAAAAAAMGGSAVSGRQHHQHSHHQRGGANNSNVATTSLSLFSPSTSALGTQMGISDSTTTTASMRTMTGAGISPELFATTTGTYVDLLHAKIAVTCLYRQDAGAAEACADTIFLASNYQATGTLVLVMTQQCGGGRATYGSCLTLYSILSPTTITTTTTIHQLYEDTKLSVCSVGPEMSSMAYILIDLLQLLLVADRRHSSTAQNVSGLLSPRHWRGSIRIDTVVSVDESITGVEQDGRYRFCVYIFCDAAVHSFSDRRGTEARSSWRNERRYLRARHFELRQRCMLKDSINPVPAEPLPLPERCQRQGANSTATTRSSGSPTFPSANGSQPQK